MSAQKSRVEEEDDLDDLDDVLDQFASPPQPTTTTTTAKPAPSATTTATSQPTEGTTPSKKTAPDAHEDDPALLDALAKEMEALFSNIRNDPGTGSDKHGGASAAERAQLSAAWEAMLIEGMNEMTGSSSAPSSSAEPSSGKDFQSRIRSTMNQLRESESKLRPSDAPPEGGDQGLDALLAQLKDAGGLDGDGKAGDEQLQGMLEAMMGQLMSKEVLYEPLKELHDKFPGYLAEHAKTISAEDKKRYDAQILCIKRLLDAFNDPSYRDEDEKTHGKIVDLMSELQSHGSPPEEIMGPLPPGFNMGSDGLPEMPEGCNMN